MLGVSALVVLVDLRADDVALVAEATVLLGVSVVFRVDFLVGVAWASILAGVSAVLLVDFRHLELSCIIDHK